MNTFKLTLVALLRSMSKGTLPIVLLLLVLALLLLAVPRQIASAATLCVNPGGTGGCFASIQAAVNAASSGDTINIAPGTYAENVGILNKPLTLPLTLLGTSTLTTFVDTISTYNSNQVAISNLTIGLFGNDGGTNVSLTNINLLSSAHNISIFNSGILTLTNVAVIGSLGYPRQPFVFGIENGGNAILTNVTVSGNQGGGIRNIGSMTLTNVTVTHNGERLGNGGVQNRGTIFVKNTIFAYNVVYDCPLSINPILSLGHNLDSDGTCPFNATGDITNTDPLLGSLGYYGGSTLVYPLMTGSPAIDAGTNVGCPSTDQRGFPRPYGVSCDIGAYEYQPPFVWYFYFFPWINR